MIKLVGPVLYGNILSMMSKMLFMLSNEKESGFFAENKHDKKNDMTSLNHLESFSRVKDRPVFLNLAHFKFYGLWEG